MHNLTLSKKISQDLEEVELYTYHSSNKVLGLTSIHKDKQNTTKTLGQT
jgi:hypothetical protein